MADLFNIKERLKFSLKLVAVGIGLGLFASAYFWNHLEFELDRNKFNLSAIISGSLVIGWLGLFIVYLAAKRITNPSRNMTDKLDSLPWELIRMLVLLVLIALLGIYIYRLTGITETEFDMVRDGKLELLKERLKANPSKLEKTETKNGPTLAQVAFREGHHDALRLLFQMDVSMEDLDPDGQNLLLASLNNVAIVKVILEFGFDANQPDQEGIQPIHYAVELHNHEILNALLEAGANIDARDQLFRTPLIHAVESLDLSMIKALLENGARVNENDRRGDTALHKATRSRNVEVIQLLLKYGADPKLFNFVHFSPLHLAAADGYIDIVKLYLDYPDMVELAGEDHMTAFEHALLGLHYDTAEVLIENGADINRVQLKGDTLLHRTILNRDYRTARFLIRVGASAEIPNAEGETVHEAMRRKHLSGLLDLITARDNPESVTNNVESTIIAELE